MTNASPSKDQVLWTETHLAYDVNAEYSYTGPDTVDFGHGRRDRLASHYTDLRHLVTGRFLMAFLTYTGLEWQRFGFSGASQNFPAPEALSSLNAILATDFRWSDKDMVRLQVLPGLYTDFDEAHWNDVNFPFALAYTHIHSETFQWTLALSVNAWRGSRIIPAPGFRWQINERWKLKALLPTPQIEYKAAPALHLSIGADFRGDTFRVGDRFGSHHGDASLNNALVDYRETRIGAGFSWNIQPLLELNGQAGYLVERQFDYHNNGLHASGRGAPYVGLNLRYLFQIRKDERSIPQQVRAMQVAFPQLRSFIKLPK